MFWPTNIQHSIAVVHNQCHYNKQLSLISTYYTDFTQKFQISFILLKLSILSGDERDQACYNMLRITFCPILPVCMRPLAVGESAVLISPAPYTSAIVIASCSPWQRSIQSQSDSAWGLARSWDRCELNICHHDSQAKTRLKESEEAGGTRIRSTKQSMHKYILYMRGSRCAPQWTWNGYRLYFSYYCAYP